MYFIFYPKANYSKEIINESDFYIDFENKVLLAYIFGNKLDSEFELFIKNNNEYLYIDINQFQILLILCIIGSV